MKKTYLFLVCITICAFSYGQENCSNADSNLMNAYSHLKSAYSSNTPTHLKYYITKSLEAFKLAKPKLNACGCKAAYNKVFSAMELLKIIESEEINEDVRFYLKRTQDMAKASMDEMEKHSFGIDEKQNTVAVQNPKGE